ncbi:MAG: carbohydrate ABC transporter substrate-binding protein [Clostridiaceae bacterium]|nr:carbohydrate ABC transporter substrate-binding protein [Clostridiaceae bacterium]
MYLLKRVAAIILLVAMVLSAAGCNSTTTNTGDNGDTTTPNATQPASTGDKTQESQEGKVLRIYCWNDEFKSRFTDYFEKKGKLPSDVKVEWVITPNQNNAYQNKLDEDLLNQDKAAEKIDIFLIEADYALKYVDTDYTLDVINEVGLTKEELANQYKYTQEIATDSQGRLKAVSWQATPGLFAYRRSIAKEVLGTDDPVEVQKQLSDWDKFDAVAAKMYEKGYKMLSGYDDAFRVFSNNVSHPWVDENNKIVIDPNLMRWVDQTKLYTEKGYNNKTSLWSAEWSADQGPNGKVFGFFYSTWGINFTLLGNSLAVPESEGGKKEVGNGIFGDWAVCEGPQSYYWGGTWICAARGTDNISLVREVMRTLTCDAETMKQITIDTEDYTNNIKAMNEIANSDYGSAFLGGQNHIALFASAAPKIDMSNISKYDQGMNEEFQAAFKDYFDGNVTKEQALENFYTAVLEKYPNLSR